MNLSMGPSIKNMIRCYSNTENTFDSKLNGFEHEYHGKGIHEEEEEPREDFSSF